MDKFVIGVDGGGTKTDVLLVDHSGSIIGRTKGGSTNIQAIGAEKLRQELLSLFNKLLKGANVHSNKISRIFLGLAGAGRKNDQETIRKLFENTDYRGKVIVDSDAMIALAGAFGNRPGIILIAGTGAICFGMNAKGNVLRSGGWGYLLGDEGSGYYIGHAAILASLRDFDGRSEKTTLRKQIETKFKLNTIDEIIPLVYQNKIDRVSIADLAPMVFDEAKKGDEIAGQVIKRAGNELGKLAKSVAERLSFIDNKLKVALIGSIFKQKEMLVNEISKELYEISWDIEITDPEFDPAVGAAILALEKNSIIINDHILENLKNSSFVTI